MKQKVTITLTIEPRDYGLKGTATNAVCQAQSIIALGRDQIMPGTRIRVSSGKVVRYYTPRP